MKDITSNINYLAARDNETLNLIPRVILQILVFSQGLIYAGLFWVFTESVISALYGFMFGSLATIIATVLQCHQNYCMRHGLPDKFSYKQSARSYFWVVKPAFALTFLFFQSPTLA